MDDVVLMLPATILCLALIFLFRYPINTLAAGETSFLKLSATAYLACHWCLSALTAHWYSLSAPERPKVRAVLDKPMKKRLGFELATR